MISFPPGTTAADIREACLGMSEIDVGLLRYDWGTWARDEQLWPAGEWLTWLILGGRGSGKTRPMAEAIRAMARDPKAVMALIGPTAADVRKVLVEGESGILNITPPEERPDYKPSVRELRWASGALAYTYSAEEPERLRGPQHSAAFLDEIAAYPDPRALWDLLLPGLRLGRNPRRICATTPKPIKFLHDLIADPMTRVTRMKTWDNRLNLPASAIAEMQRLYGGTRIGRQELEGELLDEDEGALWHRRQIDDLRVAAAPELRRIIVAIDPSSGGEKSDEIGIVAAGLGIDGAGYVLRDASCKLPPSEWAHRAISVFDDLSADKIIAEINFGGALVEEVLRTVRRNIPYETITASRGKTARAEPIAALYEQRRVHHVGSFPKLEDQMVTWVPGQLSKSPDRADALVWALTVLMTKPPKQGRALWL